MPNTVSGWSDVATIVSAILAIVGLSFVWYQIRQFTKAQRSESRAYVSAKAEPGISRGRTALYLVLKNHGKSPARDVHIEFDQTNDWHYVEHSDKFPFIGENRILVVWPDEEKKFFLGPMTKGSRLLQLKSATANGTLIYKDETGKEHKEPIALTLIDTKFAAR